MYTILDITRIQKKETKDHQIQFKRRLSNCSGSPYKFGASTTAPKRCSIYVISFLEGAMLRFLWSFKKAGAQ